MEHQATRPLPASGSLLRSVEVRPIFRQERVHWDRVMAAKHYLGFHGMVGESIRYVATYQGHWVALLGWSAAALKCKARDRWIGWTPWVQTQRLSLVANNSRFLIVSKQKIPNLASRLLSLNLKRLSKDWQKAYGHPIFLAETFVDPRLYRGTCYQAANWTFLGKTHGFARCAGEYRRHDQPKMVFVRPVIPQARQWLRDPVHQPPLGREIKPMKLSQKHAESLLECLRNIPDPRMKRGIRHRKLSVLAITICALLCRAHTLAAIAEWAKVQTQPMLKRLGCRYDKKKGQFVAPSEPTIRRFLQTVDAEAVDQGLCAWFQTLDDKGPVAIDGKTLRGARREKGKKVHLLSAFLHNRGTVIAQCEVDEKTNEIPMVPKLLESVDIAGRVVTLDAMHTQAETARYIVEQKKADYLFTVKDNQKTLKQDIEDLCLNTFPPSARNDR